MSLKQFLCELSDTIYDAGYLDHSKVCEMFKRLGSGCSRYVFEIFYEDTTYAIKFALDGYCVKNNRREARAWRTSSKEVRALMAEVYDISTCGRVLAMELVPQTLGEVEDSYDLYKNWTSDLRYALALEGYSHNETSAKMNDNHYGNIGVRENGDVVWIDYALV